MNFFSPCLVLDRRPSWVLLIGDKKATQPKPLHSVAATVRPFFGTSPELSLRFKPQYQSLRCGLCRKFDSDEVFAIGFDGNCCIRLNGHFGFTFDRVILISQKFLHTLRVGGVGGFETKPIGDSGWHALRINRFVDANPDVIKTSGSICQECGRPEESWGLYKSMSELSLPSEPNTFFTPKQGWPSAPYYDRQIFFTEDVLNLLKSACIVGGPCFRLWTDHEKLLYEEMRKRGVDKNPAKSVVYLNGFPLKSIGNRTSKRP